MLIVTKNPRMFNKDFYPTPISVLNLMQIDCLDKIVLEPSAGKGDMVMYLKDGGAKQVLACELNEDLAKIVSTKSKFLKHDFFQVMPREVSHVNAIVMNPPFSAGSRHVLHAWDIAPAGCEITALVNFETIDNTFTKDRKQLSTIIRDYGYSINLGDCYADADRATGIDIGLIKLCKPKDAHNEFEGFFMDEEIEEAVSGNGIMPFNSVRDVVQRYVNSVKCFEEHLVISEKMNKLNSLFDVDTFCFKIGYQNEVTTKDEYKKGLQKKAWEYLFHVMNLKKYVTSGVMKDINSFVETQTKVPFTMKNIYKMFEIIVGTRQQTFDRSLVEAIDKFTRHTHENRYQVEGWKTNSGHLLNKKIIIPYMVETGFSDYLTPRYSQYNDGCYDLIKVLCNITASNYYAIPDLSKLCRDVQMQPGTWYDWGFFRIKGFKKGTLHMQFNDLKVWEMVNRAYGKIKGQVLPEKI